MQKGKRENMLKMSTIILKNLVTEKATRRYPLERREPYNAVRGELFNDIAKCNYCGICMLKCPSQCITTDKKEAIWECETAACIFCGVCVEACPKQSLSQKQTYQKPSSGKVRITGRDDFP